MCYNIDGLLAQGIRFNANEYAIINRAQDRRKMARKYVRMKAVAYGITLSNVEIDAAARRITYNRWRETIAHKEFYD